MILNNLTIDRWIYLPVVLSSVAILVTQVNAAPAKYRQAKQVDTINYHYAGSGSSVGISINDDGDTTLDANAVLSEDNDAMTSGGLWAGIELDDNNDAKIQSGGVRLDHNWVVRDGQGRADHVNKVYAAYDKNRNKHEKATLGFGQERESAFWEGHVNKGVSRKKQLTDSSTVSEKAYDYGVGASVGTFLEGANLRVRGGVDYQWGEDQAADEEKATLLSVSAGIEKFFQDSPHSVGVDIRSDRKKGGYANSDAKKVSTNLSYRYNFGGDNIFQPDRRYRRVRVEVAGKKRAARYVKRPIYSKKTTQVPVYGNKTIKVPYKQLVKSTMELEGQTFFKLDSANLIPSAQQRLKQIAAQIRRNGYKGVIRITGNTCKLGDTLYDQRLSERRAATVRAFLVREGFNPRHLIARGVGKSNPKYPTTPDQDFKNRRVDIEYVSVQSHYKTGYRNITQHVQTGTRFITKNIKIGYKNVLIDKGAAGTPRVVWRTEAIATAPAWIKRALHNTIKHQRGVDTYFTSTEATSPDPLAPLANNDTGTVISGESVTIDVLANDIDNEGKGIQIVTDGFSQGSNGTVALVNGQFVYTSVAGFVGTDHFNYTIIDASGDKSSASVTITVTQQGTDIAVTAQDFTDTIKQGTNSVLNVLTGATGEELTLQGYTQGANGLVTKGVNVGELVYTPRADFVGTDHYTYTVVDKAGNTATATVTIHVTEVGGDKAPDAQDDHASTYQNEAVTIDVLANDIDHEGNGIKVTTVTQGAHGTVTINADGEINYQPNTDYIGTDSFSYTISDGSGDTATAQVTISVVSPDAGGDDCCTVTIPVSIKSTGGSFAVLANNDTRTIVSVSSSEGTIELQQSDALKHTLFFNPKGYIGTATITYELSDGSSKTISIECYYD